MVHDLQKADMWKRIAAWMFDMILLSVLGVGLCFLMSGLLGYDNYSKTVEHAYAQYESEYGVVFDISQETYLEMSDAERANYDTAYDALIADEEAVYAYNMMLNLTLVIISLGLLAAILLWEFVIPLWFGNGQTLGKRIFGLCLVRNDGVQMNNLQLFARTVLGKYTLETMIPVYILLMLFWGTMDLTGTTILVVLLFVQVACVVFTRTNSAIHDLLAGTVVVDKTSQTIFRTTEDLIAFKKQAAAEQAARQAY